MFFIKEEDTALVQNIINKYNIIDWQWIEKLEELIDENDLDYEYEYFLKEIKKTIAKFSQI